MTGIRTAGPESTAQRVALWRALHLAVDPPPHVIVDDLALALAAPEGDWRARGDMHPTRMRALRAAMAARARFVDDLVVEQVERGVTQYVILGAGLDTFVQRHPDLAGTLQVYEIDQPGPQAWKRRRLDELGHGVPGNLHLVPVDFEAADVEAADVEVADVEVAGSWWDDLLAAGFDPDRPAVVASVGVSMYLTEDTTSSTVARLAALAPGSTVAMTFLVPPALLDPAARRQLQGSARGARRSGTPFVSFYAPEQLLALFGDHGFADVRHVAGVDLAQRYFAGRDDGLAPAAGEDFVVAVR